MGVIDQLTWFFPVHRRQISVPFLPFSTAGLTQVRKQTKASQLNNLEVNFRTQDSVREAEVAEHQTATNKQRTQAKRTELVFTRQNAVTLPEDP